MFDHRSVLSAWRAGGDPAARAAAEALLSDRSRGRRFVFGCNAYGEALAEGLDADAFVVTTPNPPAVFAGRPVLAASQTPADAILVSSVVVANPRRAVAAMGAIPAAARLHAGDLVRLGDARAPRPQFVTETAADLEQNAGEWAWLFERLADDASRRVLSDVLSYRLTGDPAFLASYETRPRDQYFDAVVSLDRPHVFADVGAFDGETSGIFMARCPDYRRIHLFEPSAANVAAAQARLRGARDVVYHRCGVSDRPGRLRFADGEGSASAVSDNGGVEIEVVALDEAVTEPLTFIKMDIEGWEGPALAGAQAHIAGHGPTLTIAAYHMAPDPWRLARQIGSYREGYAYHVRHYTEGYTETVLYAVPTPD